jgi:ATP-dependent helicase/nuclease subunit A
MSTLSIYKSSAGSGKTYQLTWNYLEILFGDPMAFKNILAVTFTNKAAGEMKERILQSLYYLSLGDQKALSYQKALSDKYKLDVTEISTKAEYILSLILNDFSSFHVKTIDRFFQQIIRGFTRELGLQTGYNLELNNDKILSEAVDLLMFDMNEDEELRKWMVSFATGKIREGKSWDFQTELFSLGKEVFKEEYQSGLADNMENKDFRKALENLRKDISSEISRFENYMFSEGAKSIGIINSNGFSVEDFSYNYTGIAGYLYNLSEKRLDKLEPGTRARAAAESTDVWLTKGNKNELLKILIHDKLFPVLKNIINFWDTSNEKYFTAQALKKNIYSFGILHDISARIREIALEKNLFLLSDASMFLNKIIDQNEAPFIYEKAGNYFNRFMLDEFQDTSRFQWNNFHPLIENGLSEAFPSLVVGDVKQSIYRWRSSDWKILAAELEERFKPFQLSLETLTENWRSYANIVRFNNSLFFNAPALIFSRMQKDLQNEDPEFAQYWTSLIKRVYDQSTQKIPEKFKDSKGFVGFKMLESKNAEEYLDQLKIELPELIRDIQARNYKAKDICILVRSGREGRKLAKLLIEESRNSPDKTNFNVISNDSLFLETNSAVQFLLALLKFLARPGDKMNLNFLAYEYQNYLSPGEIEGRSSEDLDSLMISSAGILDETVFKNFKEELTRLKQLPLFELVEKLILIFLLNKNLENLPFIQAFQDIVFDYTTAEMSDISSFLYFWKKNGASQTLNVSEEQDAIRIMTIHKAKGLQFDMVIVPYADWKLEPSTGLKQNILWCETENTGFKGFGKAPIVYNNNLANTSFKKYYLEEKFQSFVDNLNLIYVAFTRSKKELYIFAGSKDDNDKNETAGSLILNCLKQENSLATDIPSVNLPDYLNIEDRVFEYGIKQMNTSEPDSNDQIETVFLDDYPISAAENRLKLNIQNIYLNALEEDMSSSLGFGTIMHEVFSYIKYEKDIDKALNKVYRQGKFTEKEKSEYIEMIRGKFENPIIKDWYNENWKVRNESDLINGDGLLLRPDRVIFAEDRTLIVDYKFGKEEKEGHKKQVLEYVQALKNMNYKGIKAYLWYFTLDKIEEVF